MRLRHVKGKVLQCLKWDACVGIRRGIAKYVAAVETACPGWTPRMYDSSTPLRHLETKTSIHRAPLIAGGSFIECPNCMGAFDLEFIKRHHTFPVGTQRKVTDVFKKEVRANHLLPDDATAVCEDGMMAVSLSATTTSDDPLWFVADLIDLVGLDQEIDSGLCWGGVQYYLRHVHGQNRW